MLKVENSAVSHLFVLRHGSAKNGHLSEKGRGEILQLSKNIESLGKGILTAGNAIVAFSLADRARESAYALATSLRLSTILKPSLGDENGMDYFGQEARIVEDFAHIAGSYPCIIAVTHEPITAYLPMLLHPKVNGQQPKIINYAWARYFDPDGKVTTISPDRIL